MCHRQTKHDDDTFIALISHLLAVTAALALDTHHTQFLSKSDTNDVFPRQGIMGIDLIHHPALLQ